MLLSFYEYVEYIGAKCKVFGTSKFLDTLLKISKSYYQLINLRSFRSFLCFLNISMFNMKVIEIFDIEMELWNAIPNCRKLLNIIQNVARRFKVYNVLE